MIRGLAFAGLLAWGLSLGLSAHAATLIHTNDLLGDIEPCGCRTNPLGGMARKANMMKRLTDGSLLQLDAGDLLFSSDRLPALLQDQAELQAGYLLKSMDELHHDAIVPGEKDFALGLAKLEKLRKQTHIKFLAANIVRKKGGKPLYESSAIFTRKGTGSDQGKTLRIAVVGVVSEELVLAPELKLLPEIPAARKAVAAVRGKADLVILLSHSGLERDRELAAQVPGIDIIIGGHTQSFLQEPQTVGHTIIYQSSFRNQYVGVLPLHKPVAGAFRGEDYKLVGLDAGFDSPASQPAPTDRLVTEFKKALGELNSKDDAKLEKLTSETAATTGAKYHTFPKCAECHLKQFDFWRKTQHAAALTALIDKQQYKNKECLSCHTVGLGDPKGFLSVNQLAQYKHPPIMNGSNPSPSPSADGSEFSDAPVPLAVDEPVIETLSTEELATYLKTIHEAKSLQDKVRITPLMPVQTVRRSITAMHASWAPVQCENCHQPGKDHPFSGNYSKKVEKTVCLNCHTAERAPEWYTKAGQPDWTKIEAKRALVTCPAGDLGDASEEN